MDISTTTAPRSDQQNFDDYLAGPKTVTITEVRAGSDEQPVEIHLAEFPGRPYKPSKSMRRVLLSAWGPDSSAYVGRRMTLYGDPAVKFGGVACGGIKISHLSDIQKPLRLALTVTRAKREPHEVQPLTDATPKRATSNLDAARAGIAVAETDEQLRAVWDSLDPHDREQLAGEVKARKAELDAEADA